MVTASRTGLPTLPIIIWLTTLFPYRFPAETLHPIFFLVLPFDEVNIIVPRTFSFSYSAVAKIDGRQQVRGRKHYGKEKLDKLDQPIARLQVDGRMPYTALASELGVAGGYGAQTGKSPH